MRSIISLLITAQAVLGSLTPPDPYSYPKYSLQFLNDLPIEHSVASQWLDEGVVPGGLKAFFNELGEGESTERKAIDPSSAHSNDNGDLDEPPSSFQSSPLNYTLQNILLSPGPRNYLCLLPPTPPPLSSLPSPLPIPPMDPALPAKLLDHLHGTCLYHRQGWFTYSYCHGKGVKQFREAPRPWPPSPQGWIPKEDPQHDSYILGKADSDLQASTNHPGVSLGRGVGARYLTQKWGGGTECDRTGVSREIEIQFHCSMTGTDGIALIKEISTCSYVLVINTPRLCHIPGFSTRLSEPPAGITCREIVADGTVPKPEIEGETKTSSDRTPLPSWAKISSGSPSKPHTPTPPKQDLAKLNLIPGFQPVAPITPENEEKMETLKKMLDKLIHGSSETPEESEDEIEGELMTFKVVMDENEPAGFKLVFDQGGEEGEREINEVNLGAILEGAEDSVVEWEETEQEMERVKDEL